MLSNSSTRLFAQDGSKNALGEGIQISSEAGWMLEAGLAGFCSGFRLTKTA
jgi:hypothetical protein